MKARWLILIVAAIVGVVISVGFLSGGLPAEEAALGGFRLSAAISADATSLTNGEKTFLRWKTSGGTPSCSWADSCEASGALEVAPTETTTYTIYNTRRRTIEKSVTIEVKAPEPNPDPTPTPSGDCAIAAIGLGSAFSVADTLSLASHDHDLGGFLRAQSGTWTIIDPLMLKADHPKVLDSWVKVAADAKKTQPCVIWYKRISGATSVLAIDEVEDTTTAKDLLARAKELVPAPTNRITIRGKTYGLGAMPGKAGAKFSGKRISEILKPLAEANYPVAIDLSGQLPFLKDQGAEGTCVLQAVAQGYEAAVVRAFGHANATEFSANFLAARTQGWNGTWTSEGIKVLTEEGIVTQAEQPNYEHTLPANWKKKAALNKAIGVYGPPAEGESIGYAMAAIARGYPVVVGIAVGNGFDPDENGVITYAQGAASQVNHDVIIQGAIYTIGGRKCVDMKNSWGAWGFKREGRCYLELEFLKDDRDFAVIVVPTANDSYRFDATPAASGAAATPSLPGLETAGNDGAKLRSILEVPVAVEVLEPADRTACPDGRCTTGGPRLFRRGR